MTKRIRSKALYEFLFQKGVLGCSDSVINEFKREFRKEYKRKWKRQAKSKPQKELRPVFTIKQHEALFQKAKLNGYTPTGYLKELALASLDGKTNLLPFKERLIELLQTIILASNVLHSMQNSSSEEKELASYLQQAETQLRDYLSLH